jgi:hypothetical protein
VEGLLSNWDCLLSRILSCQVSSSVWHALTNWNEFHIGYKNCTQDNLNRAAIVLTEDVTTQGPYMYHIDAYGFLPNKFDDRRTS